MMEELLEQLEKNWGWDGRKVMADLGGDLEFLKDCLGAFARDYAFDRLNRAFIAGDWHDMAIQVHVLKGVSANLGLTMMFEDLVALERQLRTNSHDGLGMMVDKINQWQSRLQTLI
ncbi:MAG: hypothetical protein PHI41_07205 [Erysipelotrichaceae bacterium]|nr:hypothetical protein [Erysipelotrichaceae bacterium]